VCVVHDIMCACIRRKHYTSERNEGCPRPSTNGINGSIRVGSAGRAFAGPEHKHAAQTGRTSPTRPGSSPSTTIKCLCMYGIDVLRRFAPRHDHDMLQHASCGYRRC
jgi:hypothetical protein